MKSNRTVNIIIYPKKINDFLGLIGLGAALLAISISSAYSDHGEVTASGVSMTTDTSAPSLAAKRSILG